MKPRSLELNLLIAFLKQCYSENKLATYAEMAEFTQKDEKRKRYFITGALKVVRDEYGYLFKCDRGLGYRPILNDAKLSIVELNRLSRIKSQVEKWEFELGTIESASLPQPEKERFFTSQIKLSAHQMILDDRLEQAYAIAGQKCVASGKVDFDLGDIKQAFKALTM